MITHNEYLGIKSGLAYALDKVERDKKKMKADNVPDEEIEETFVEIVAYLNGLKSKAEEYEKLHK